MRYFLGATTLLLVMVAATLLPNGAASRGRPNSTGAQARAVATAQPVNEEAERLEREARRAPTQSPGILTRRENLLAAAMARADAMSEGTPRLLALRATTVREFGMVFYKGAEEERFNLGPDDRGLFVAQMAGTFSPLRLPPDAGDSWPKEGTLYVIFSADTGQIGSTAIRTGPPIALPGRLVP